jgi:hypothetical protein
MIHSPHDKPEVAAARQTYQSGGMSITVTGPKASPVGFVALFPAADDATTPFPYFATAPVSPSNLMMALVFIGPDRQIYWAHRLLG